MKRQSGNGKRQSDKGIKIIDAKAVPFNEKIRNHILNCCRNTLWERSLSDRLVKVLATEMVQKNFLYKNVDLATCVLNGVEYRISGQHVCWAVEAALESNPDFASSYAKRCPKVMLIRYKAESESDLRNMYR